MTARLCGNIDLLGLRLLLFGQVHLEHAVLHPGGNLLRIDRGGQSEGAMERSVGTFDPVVILLLDLLLELAISAQGEDTFLDLDVDVVLFSRRAAPPGRIWRPSSRRCPHWASRCPSPALPPAVACARGSLRTAGSYGPAGSRRPETGPSNESVPCCVLLSSGPILWPDSGSGPSL